MPEFSSGLLFDGATGTQLLACGLRFDCPERLNLTRPDAVRAVHRAYVEAGADVIEANALGANPIRLRAFGLEAECARITETAAALARESGAKSVACPVGTTLQYGREPDGVLFRAFARQTQAAARAGADLIFCETLTCLAEARLMFAAAQETGLPFGASFFFGADGLTPAGDSPAACARAAQEAGACMAGVNCMSERAPLIQAITEMRAACSLPLIAQPSAGLPGRRMDVEAFAALTAELLRAGASHAGGCCGTTSEYIRRIAPMVHKGDGI